MYCFRRQLSSGGVRDSVKYFDEAPHGSLNGAFWRIRGEHCESNAAFLHPGSRLALRSRGCIQIVQKSLHNEGCEGMAGGAEVVFAHSMDALHDSEWMKIRLSSVSGPLMTGLHFERLLRQNSRESHLNNDIPDALRIEAVVGEEDVQLHQVEGHAIVEMRCATQSFDKLFCPSNILRVRR